ncbi:hypothetical protein AF927_10440 [Listeria monocytogenes]|uniref:hypothetical protein n=1 Tax=Listeria monocytogenes TaxID=1639 RepID=UPI0008689FF6|nr:hypothetical protein [Listeria monocytogenes]EAD5401437.1 hypothetical protein [Listeria monocytogenes]EAE7318902.1 hypothetical protein [Listeria monocytogenes]EAG6757634.1 hypothetical protein [Listeria monocytogenes]EAG9447983.1 hypothetical protein [Listeria monocytogenes]EDB3198907.1 hypothetical protein [Listeria monocytogenes]
MKKLKQLTNRLFTSTILLITMLFIIPPTFAIADGSKVSFYEYIYGAPLRWLTVISPPEKKGTFLEMFFSENEGINIQWLNLIINFLLVFLVITIIFSLAKKFYNKKNA